MIYIFLISLIISVALLHIRASKEYNKKKEEEAAELKRQKKLEHVYYNTKQNTIFYVEGINAKLYRSLATKEHLKEVIYLGEL